MKSLTQKLLRQDEEKLDALIQEKRQEQVDLQSTILRLEGGLMYIRTALEQIERDEQDTSRS
jgi:hypothetical protein